MKQHYTYDALVPKTSRKLIWYALKPYRGRWAIFFTLTLFGTIAWMAIPYVVGQIVNELVGDTVVSNRVWMLAGLFALMHFFNETFWRIADFYARGFKPHMVERVRSSLFAGCLQRSYSYFVNNSSGRVGYWINRAADTFSSTVDITIWDFWGSIAGLVIAAVFLFFAHWTLAVLFIVWLVVLFFFTIKRGKRHGELVAEFSDETSIAAGMVVDAVSNNTSVRVYNETNQEQKSLLLQQNRIIHKRRRSWLYGAVTNMVKGYGSVFSSAVALVLLLVLYERGDVRVGDIVVFVAYFQNAGQSLWEIAWVFDRYYEDFGTIQNALDGLGGENERVGELPAGKLKQTSASVELRDVSFAYPDQPGEKVLNKLNLVINDGEKVGIVGHSGAGKSTLIGLLLGFYDPSEGGIFVNGVNVIDADPSFVRNVSSYVPQDTNLFNRTIKENVMYARPDATEKELMHALTQAKATEFVSKLPDGVNTLIGERGVKLSGGQRQRIAIARAILKDSPFLLLDEATSALDSVSEQAIQKALHELMKKRTALVIAHRLSTLKHLDKIIVLEKGKIAEQGTHDELIKRSGIYADLWRRQKDGFIAE